MILLCFNHHRGRYASPALADASYPFADLPTETIVHYKLFPSGKFSEIQLYIFSGIAYNEACDKTVVCGGNNYHGVDKIRRKIQTGIYRF